MKKICLLLVACCLFSLCALPAMAQEHGLPVIRITFDADTPLSAETAVDAQVTLVQTGQETVFGARLRLNDGTADAVELALPQKSLCIDGEGIRFLLFNDGGDALNTKITSAVCCNLIGQSAITTPVRAQEPVEVYLNGEYWGLYTKREMLEDAVVRFENLNDAAHLNIARANQKAVCGDASGLAELFQRVQSLDLLFEEDRQTLSGLLDTDSFLNCIAVNTYFGNTNLYGELYFYQNGSGPWKCITGDFAYAFYSAADHSVGRLIIEKGKQNYWGKAAELADRLLRVPVYRDAFLHRLGALYQSLPTPVMQAAVDAENARITSALPAHMDRWAEPFAQTMSAAYHYPATDGAEALLFQNWRVARLRDQTLALRPYYVYDSVQRALEISDAEMEKWFGSAKPGLPETAAVSRESFQTFQP